MHLDVASPSIIDNIDGDSIVFIIVGAIIILCIISIIIYKKVKGRKVRNEKN